MTTPNHPLRSARLVVESVSIQPEDILGDCDPSSRLRIFVYVGDDIVWQSQELPVGEIEILVEELAQ